MPFFSYVPEGEFIRMFELQCSRVELAQIFADLCRINTLYMISFAGSGHIGSSFSSLDIVSWLFLNKLKRREGQDDFFQDVYFSSKGHDVPGLYSVLIGLGLLEFDMLHRLRRLNGLPGHPDISTAHIVTNTGSLGMGISKAKGMVQANRISGRDSRIFVMIGDGELQEGQLWESLISAANTGMDEITVIVDYNKLQSDSWIAQTSDLGDIEAKFLSFGWHVLRCDGHDFKSFDDAIEETKSVKNKPHVIIADTVKGKGVSFMTHSVSEEDDTLYPYHSGSPDFETYEKALAELVSRVNEFLLRLKQKSLLLESVPVPKRNPPSSLPQRLISAYSKALVMQAEKRSDIVVLDADLKSDCGLIPFEKRFPERFVECGIAEQDMVSQAGGFALSNFLPVVHSFACFLSTRANEQIYNNATEKKKIIYTGSLAGILPSGPGHSHQSVRDIAALASVPDLILIEPCNEQEVEIAVDFCVNQTSKSSYIRLVSIPYGIPFKLPQGYALELGKGFQLREGNDVIIFAYGPVLLSEAYKASELLREKYKIGLKVINLPWLNVIDKKWLQEIVGNISVIITLDNHYKKDGQGEMIALQIQELNLGKVIRIISIGLEDVPKCGQNEEILEACGLNADSLVRKINNILS